MQLLHFTQARLNLAGAGSDILQRGTEEDAGELVDEGVNSNLRTLDSHKGRVENKPSTVETFQLQF
ncbi:aldo/keto reductase family protein [Anopheles sinensis]|uniref:Aldo/keto reductase family protein n=1 Tax=Anopheles sinensis TaxID=74873 RepID=A0A084VY91_ANOSI|nr:aldo/keto reductase family protein [Anopheles sinensis]